MGCNASKEAKDEKGEAPYTPSKGEEQLVAKSSAKTSAAPPKPGRSPQGENGHVQKGQLSPDGRKPGDYSSLERSATLRRDKERARLEFFGIDPDTKKRSPASPEPNFSILDQKLGITPDTSPHRLYTPSTEKDGYVKEAAGQIDQRASQIEPESEFPPASPPAYIGEREKGGTGNVKEKIQYMEDVKEGKVNPNLRFSKSPSPRLSTNDVTIEEVNGDVSKDESVVVANGTAEFGKGLLEGVHREDVLLIKEREQGKHKDEEPAEEGGVDPAQHGAQMEDRFYNNKAFEKPDVDPSDPQQQEAALAIQTKYRQFNAKKVVEEKRQEQAAVKIQSGFRGFQDRQKVKSMRSGEDVTAAADGDAPAEEEVDIDLEDPEVAAAASKIQAGFKGYKARKEVQDIKAAKAGTQDPAPAEEGKPADAAEEEVDIDLNDPEVEKAATKIQAGFKGYKARKGLADKDDAQDTEGESHKPSDNKEVKLEEEEEVDIDLEDPEVEKAAIKIQAGFSRFKKAKKAERSSAAEDSDAPAPAKEPVPEQSSLLEGHSSQEAGKEEKTKTKDAPVAPPAGEEEEIDIDLEDPEVEKAAIKIQAKFSQLKKFRKPKPSVQAPSPAPVGNTDTGGSQDKPPPDVVKMSPITQEEEVIDIDLDDPEVEKAALKIQNKFSKLKMKKKTSSDIEKKTQSVQSSKDCIPNKVVETGSVSGQCKNSKNDEKSNGKQEEEEIDIDLEDPEVEKAALKIQNKFSKLKMKKKQSNPGASTVVAQKVTEGSGGCKPGSATVTKGNKQPAEEEIDIDLDDPEVEKAALKIQNKFSKLKMKKRASAPVGSTVPKQSDSIKENPATVSSAEQDASQASGVQRSPLTAPASNPPEEEIDIDLNDPEVEKAALKIQNKFSKLKFKRKAQSEPLTKDYVTPSQQPPLLQPLPAKKASTEKPSVSLVSFTQAEEIDIDLNDPEVEKAAVKIQSQFSKLKVKKRSATSSLKQEGASSSAKETKPEPEPEAKPEAEEVKLEAEEEEVDIDLEDPDVEKAATKIQAGFKGFKARKEVQAMKAGDDAAVVSEDPVADAPVVSQAAESEAPTENEVPAESEAPVVSEAPVENQAAAESADKAPAESIGQPEPEVTPAELQTETNAPATDVIPDNQTEAANVTRDEVKPEEVVSNTPAPEEPAAPAEEPTQDTSEEQAPIPQEAEPVSDESVPAAPASEQEEPVPAPAEEKAADDAAVTEDADQGAAPEEPKKEGEEEVDIDLNDPEVEKAATKIQAGFKGMKTRQEIASMKATSGEGEEKGDAAPAEEEVDIDLNDPEVEKAATKIQAGFKGMKTRKELKDGKEASPEAEGEVAPAEAPAEEAPKEEAKEEEVDIDLNDPEVEKAATKIQAGFKGMKTRKELKDGKEGSAEPEGGEEAPKEEAPAAEDAPAEAPAEEGEAKAE